MPASALQARMTLSWWTLTKSEAAKREAKYQLAFKPAALAEWNALDGSVKELFRSVLKKRLGSPHFAGQSAQGRLKRLLQNQTC